MGQRATILISLEVHRPGRGMGKKYGKDKNFGGHTFFMCLRYGRLIP
jgi:hypothetical protein